MVADTNTTIPEGTGTFTGFLAGAAIDQGDVAFNGFGPDFLLGTYANIDGINAATLDLPTDKLTLLDRWILSRLNSVVVTARERLDNYDTPAVTRAVEGFVDDM